MVVVVEEGCGQVGAESRREGARLGGLSRAVAFTITTRATLAETGFQLGLDLRRGGGGRSGGWWWSEGPTATGSA